MPVHPTEENAPEGLTEKLAKDPSSMTESTASDHPDHANEHNPLGMYSFSLVNCSGFARYPRRCVEGDEAFWGLFSLYLI